MKQKTFLLSKAGRYLMLLTVLTIGVAQLWADTTGQQTSFTATSGGVNSSTDITYACYKGSGTSNPQVNSGAIRLYQNSAGYHGGIIVITAGTGCTINSVTIGSSMSTTVGYQLKDTHDSDEKATDYLGSSSLSANSTKTYDGLSTSVISIACLGTTSSTRLYINKLSVTYTKAASCGKPTATTNGTINATTQTVSWTAPSPAPANGYLVAYSTATSTAPGDAVKTAGTSGNYTVVAIAAGTKTYNIPCNSAGTYNWWVRSKCGASDFSDWVAGPSSFTRYSVTYNANGSTGGSVPTDATKYGYNKSVTVKDNTGSLAKTGWTFAGWNKNNTGTSTNYAAGTGTFSITANTTLYAKWTCTVTWSVNGATNVYPAQTVTYNPSGSKVSSVPTPDPASYCGQVFAGWTTEAYSGNSAPAVLFKTVSDSPNLNSTGSATFYAVFADYAN